MLVLSKYKIMKSTIYNLLTFFLILGCFVSCSDEDYSKSSDNSSEEKAVKIRLSLKSEESTTKSLDNILGQEDENKIRSLQLFIFRRHGDQEIVKDYYFPEWSDKKVVEAYTGRFLYVFVANLDQEWLGVTRYSDIKDKLYSIASESDISANKTLAAVFNKELLIPYPSAGSDVVELKDGTDAIMLKRLSSKVILNLTVEGTTPENEPLIDRLNIKSVQLRNASNTMYFFNEDAPLDEFTLPTIDYPIRTFDIHNGLDAIHDQFYILERKANDKLEQGSYMEIKAEYRDMSSSVPTKLVTYKARFNTLPFENNEFKGLFNVVRNHQYQLNIKILGANEDDIRVEVEELQEGGVYVSCNATGRGTGATWEDAFNTIGEAIVFASEYNKNNPPLSYIYVKEGTYTENIILPDGLTIVGGFGNHLTGTNIKDHNGSIKPVLRPAPQSGNSSSIVTFPSSLTLPTKLCYFIIEGGQATHGGGVSMESQHATMHACRIRNNNATQGGGIYLEAGQVWNCIIDNNGANTNGGGIYIANNAANTVIQNSTVVNNRWLGARPQVQQSKMVNNPSSGIYAASGAVATVNNSILHGNDDISNIPVGVSYRFCAFASNDILTWDEICNANLRICTLNAPSANQPFATDIHTPGFKDETSYELSETSLLLSRGYVGKNKEGWNHPDYNGKYPTNNKFPDLGAIQSPYFKELLEMYVQTHSFLPFMDATIECFITSNIINNNFWSNNMAWAVRPADADYYKPMKLKAIFANVTNHEQMLSGEFTTSSKSLAIEFMQSYLNFELSTAQNKFNYNRNLYLMPTEANESYELFTHTPMRYTVKTSIADKDIEFINLENNKFNWLDVNNLNTEMSYKNSSFTQEVNQSAIRSIAQSGIGFNYLFKSFDIERLETIYPFDNNNFQLIQIPEWSLGEFASVRILGLNENDNLHYFNSKTFTTWQFNVATPQSTSLHDGKANTAEALNTMRTATNYKWDTTSEEAYKKTQNNAFIFCASLNPEVRKKLIDGNQTITAEELTWYLPSLNELKYITVFGSLHPNFSREEYYITSTFSERNIRRFSPVNLEEWKSSGGIEVRPGYLRCVRSTTTSPTAQPSYGGVQVANSADSYILESEGMTSFNVVQKSKFTEIPDESQLSAKFEIEPTNEPNELSFKEAIAHCSNLPQNNDGSSWRLPTRKELILIHLHNQSLVVKDHFSPLDAGDYFVSQPLPGTEKKVFDMEQGSIASYQSSQARVRCVRSIK